MEFSRNSKVDLLEDELKHPREFLASLGGST
jgi:hypothetical protein